MTEERLNPLTWLQGKFAQLVHTHTKSQITDLGTIPSKTSDLQNDGDGTNSFLTQHQSLTNYVQKSNTTGLLKNDGTVMTSGTGSSNWATGNHTHSGYASSSHTHNYSDVNNVSVATVTVTYSDQTTGTIKLLQYTGS